VGTAYRVRIVTNDNIIEQITDFKYLGYRISEYNIQQNKWSYTETFWKKINKETKLRIHSITAKAALKFGSEAWVLKN
jgi:hypothetical protein